MSKHTTLPRKAWMSQQQHDALRTGLLLLTYPNRNASLGNRNKHAQRRIPSSIRTKGRIKRFNTRLLGETPSAERINRVYEDMRAMRKGLYKGSTWTQLRNFLGRLGAPNAIAAKATVNERLHSGEYDDAGHEDMGRDGWKAEGGAP